MFHESLLESRVDIILKPGNPVGQRASTASTCTSNHLQHLWVENWCMFHSQCPLNLKIKTVWHWLFIACTSSMALWSQIKPHHRRKENISRQNPEVVPSDHPDIIQVSGMIMKPSSIHGFAGHCAIVCSPCHNTMKDNKIEIVKTHELLTGIGRLRLCHDGCRSS